MADIDPVLRSHLNCNRGDYLELLIHLRDHGPFLLWGVALV